MGYKYLNIIKGKFIIIFFLVINLTHAQDKDQYLKSYVYNFYKSIKKDKCISLQDFEDLFTHGWLEGEGKLSFNRCLENNDSSYCYAKGQNFMNNKGNYCSVLIDTIINLYYKDLGLHKSLTRINKTILKSNIENSFIKRIVYVKVDLGNRDVIHFKLLDGKVLKSGIRNIYLPNGVSAFNKFTPNNSRLRKIGIINDPDGYTNLRKGRGTNYDVIKKVKKDSLFFFYPTQESNWWEVQTFNCEEGYMHKSRIQPFDKWPESKQEHFNDAINKQYDARPCKR